MPVVHVGARPSAWDTSVDDVRDFVYRAADLWEKRVCQWNRALDRWIEGERVASVEKWLSSNWNYALTLFVIFSLFLASSSWVGALLEHKTLARSHERLAAAAAVDLAAETISDEWESAK